MKVGYISDFFYPSKVGGAEMVDNTIIDYLASNGIEVDRIKSSDIETGMVKLDTSIWYIISNSSLLSIAKTKLLSETCKYIIIEHDYKIHCTRHPWRFENCIVPKNELINIDLYKNAKVVYTQTLDHLSVFNDNKIEGNFKSLDCSIWSEDELSFLYLLNKQNRFSSKSFCVIQSDNYIKNTAGAISFCNNLKLSYNTVSSNINHTQFIQDLVKYSTLVFFPIARETCCRLIVEAKCLGLNVITNNNSGAFKSDWFELPSLDLIKYLQTKSQENLKGIFYDIG